MVAQHCAASDVHVKNENYPTLAFYRGEKLTIPVVVHIVFNEDEENISNEQIFSQIEVLNQDFSKKNKQDFLPNDFKNVAADVNIAFELAKYDPKGKISTGITRTFTTSKDVWQEKALLNGIQRRKVYFTNIEGRDAWDSKKYLNIWVCKMPNGKSGYATFPNQVKADESDGIVVDYRFFGTKGVALSNVPFHLGRTCTHEVGHFLNLQHLWGNSISNDDCNGDDQVNDTPKQTGPIAGCPQNPINQCGKSTMFQNFMNYASDDCMALFTEGQKNRMIDAITQFRPTLNASYVAVNELQLTDIQLFPNPASQFVSLVTPQKGAYFLINMQGQNVAKGELEAGKNSIEIAHLSSGIYQLGIVIDNRQIIKKLNVL